MGRKIVLFLWKVRKRKKEEGCMISKGEAITRLKKMGVMVADDQSIVTILLPSDIPLSVGIKDIKAKKISRVIVYRLDRISRNIKDFYNLYSIYCPWNSYTYFCYTIFFS